MIGKEEPEDARPGAYGAQTHHHRQPNGEEPRRGCGRDQHREDKDVPHGAQGHHDRQGDEEPEQQIEPEDRDANGRYSGGMSTLAAPDSMRVRRRQMLDPTMYV